MLKKVIKFTDYDGNERTETFYFNISKAEFAEMELRTPGGLQAHIQKMVDTQDRDKLVDLFKTMILGSVGEKSPDGRRFIKSQEIRDDFAQTEAYVELFTELVTNHEAGTEFVNGILPSA